MFKRVVLFVLTNLAILIVLGVVLQVLTAFGVFEAWGYRYGPLLVIAAFFGFGGSFLSLALSKRIAKWTTGAKVIERPRSSSEQWLVRKVAELSRQAGIATPEVAIYDAPEPNAFATGATRNRSLVAVSTGLLRRMDRDEVEGVLAHEISHVANGDMVTLTLIQGVLNTFVIFFARIVGHVVDSFLHGDRDEGGSRGFGLGYWVTTIAAEIVFGIIATIIVMWFSRRREFRADAGGATLAGRQRMIAALERLRAAQEPSHLPDSMAAFGIKGGKRGGLVRLFSSHPPLEDRIAALRAGGRRRSSRLETGFGEM
ncbi:MAG: protease HtpX [Myxococcota bacterium]